jgi:hypothetical protein
MITEICDDPACMQDAGVPRPRPWDLGRVLCNAIRRRRGATEVEDICRYGRGQTLESKSILMATSIGGKEYMGCRNSFLRACRGFCDGEGKG